MGAKNSLDLIGNSEMPKRIPLMLFLPIDLLVDIKLLHLYSFYDGYLLP